MESYHETESAAMGADETVRPPVRINPYIPPIGRVLAVLWSYGPDGTVVVITAHDLASAAHCSPARIPEILDMLERDGIVTATRGPRGCRIVLDDRRSADGSMIAVQL